MRRSFRAIAVDYDGTITEGGRPEQRLLDTLQTARACGLRVVLVTGRILVELELEFPDVRSFFDALVVENGAVVVREGAAYPLASPIGFELDEALLHRGVVFRRGQVVLATHAPYEAAVLEEIRRLGLELAIVGNRGERLVLPVGVSKGIGLLDALAGLDLSPHSAVAIGDAENDHSLLEACELGVAVGNAVPALKQHADLVLPLPNGKGVLDFLVSQVLPGTTLPPPPRRAIPLGRSPDGAPVGIVAAHQDLLITGASGSGKSYLAGALAERLLQRQYTICALDLEGDHLHLDRFANVTRLGGHHAAPPFGSQLDAVLRGGSSAVVDLSLLGPEEREREVGELLEVLARQRRDSGLPHWVLVEEAHVAFPEGRVSDAVLSALRGGLCLVSYRPEALARTVVEGLDAAVVAAGGSRVEESHVEGFVAGAFGVDEARFRETLETLEIGHALLVRRQPQAAVEAFAVGSRGSLHVRHWHKYAYSDLPPAQRFYFRTGARTTGVAAPNLSEFHRALETASEEVLRHHATHRDFSRWIRDVVGDAKLAADLRGLEAQLTSSAPGAAMETVRRAVLDAIETRYLE